MLALKQVSVINDLKGRKDCRHEGKAVKKQWVWDFPGGPVVKTWPSNAGRVSSISGGGVTVPYASWPKNNT